MAGVRTLNSCDPSGHRIAIGGVPFHEVHYTRFASLPEPSSLLRAGRFLGLFSAAAPRGPAGGGAAGDRRVSPGVFVANVGGFAVMCSSSPSSSRSKRPPCIRDSRHPGATRPHASEPGMARDDHGARAGQADSVSRAQSPSQRSSRRCGPPLPPPERRCWCRRATAPPHCARPAARRASKRSPPGARSATANNRSRSSTSARTTHRRNARAWLPRERIVFQGDLYYYAAGIPFRPGPRPDDRFSRAGCATAASRRWRFNLRPQHRRGRPRRSRCQRDSGMSTGCASAATLLERQGRFPWAVIR